MGSLPNINSGKAPRVFYSDLGSREHLGDMFTRLRDGREGIVSLARCPSLFAEIVCVLERVGKQFLS